VDSKVGTPMKLYAKDTLTLIADTIRMGHVEFLVRPNSGKITCKELQLFKSTEKDPEYFSIVKGFVDLATTKIRTISTYSPIFNEETRSDYNK
jgi:hypothetical protein